MKALMTSGGIDGNFRTAFSAVALMTELALDTSEPWTSLKKSSSLQMAATNWGEETVSPPLERAAIQGQLCCCCSVREPVFSPSDGYWRRNLKAKYPAMYLRASLLQSKPWEEEGDWELGLNISTSGNSEWSWSSYDCRSATWPKIWK